jgi:LmbE family N-acetylglucosaminyl deacetylase
VGRIWYRVRVGPSSGTGFGATVVVAALAAALAISLGLGLLGRWRIRRYRALFRIPVRRHDRLETCGPRRTFDIVLEPSGFTLPDGLARAGQTAFLRLSVKVGPLGHLFDPELQLTDLADVADVADFSDLRDLGDLGSGGPLGLRQSFERGARGDRYVNLSPLFEPDPRRPLAPSRRRIRVRGRFIRAASGPASLVVFDPPSLGGGPRLVLAPHPDDAEIGAYGVYAAEPSASWVVTLTAGEGGSGGPAARLPDGVRARWNADLRVHDSLTVPRLAGVPFDRCANLAYPDGRLEEMYRAPGRAFPLACARDLSRAALRARNTAPGLGSPDADATWDGLVEELRGILEFVKATVVVCPHPTVDPHPDHVFTAVALAEALRRLDGPQPLVLLYVVHVRDVPIHPVGGAGSLVTVPPTAGSREGGEAWSADTLHSVPLSPELRQAKAFAVEASHDVRDVLSSGDDGGPGTFASLLLAVKREVSAYLSGLGRHPTSFLRRAPRPNELYHVVGSTSFARLVDRALAQRATEVDRDPGAPRS